MTDNEVLFVRSSKKNGSRSKEEASSTNEDDIWDDMLLIKAYDKAVQLAQQSYLKKKQHSEGEVKTKVKKKVSEEKWKVGDKCRCQYSVDLKYYEADIIEIISLTGMCVVKYVGYENEEKIPLANLKPSKGESVRAKQCREALEESRDHNSMEIKNDEESSTTESKANQKKSNGVKKEKQPKKRNNFNENNSFPSLNFSLPHLGNSIIPPPPPPHMFNQLSEDENETEAMSAMLISWYMSGYHTGYYQGLKMAKKQ